MKLSFFSSSSDDRPQIFIYHPFLLFKLFAFLIFLKCLLLLLHVHYHNCTKVNVHKSLFYFLTKIDRKTQAESAEGSVWCVHLILLLNSPNGIFSVVVNNWALVPSEPKIDSIITDNIILKDFILSLLNPTLHTKNSSP